MADSEAVALGIARRPGTRYSALVPNLRGLARAIGAGLREVSVFGAASEAFSLQNINHGIAEAFARFNDVIRAAGAAGVGCGATSPRRSDARTKATSRIPRG